MARTTASFEIDGLGGKNVLVVGLGRSGAAAARLAAAKGARVTITDRRPEPELAAAAAALPAGVARELGGHRAASFVGADLIVLSPGVPEIPELTAARRAGVAVTGELELAARAIAADVVAITGTNGKSTATALCGAMLRQSGRPTFVGGNLGVPLAEAVGTPAAAPPDGVCVVEVSSFQLETAERFHPRVAVLLNVTADHLDRYPDMDAYAAAKARIFQAQSPRDFAVVNADDPLVGRTARGTIAARCLWFSTRRRLDRGGWLDGGAGSDGLCVDLTGIECVADGGAAAERYHMPRRLVGRHNRENALAAACAARLAGATPADVQRALDGFIPLAHRMELVAEARGVAFFDDSKGTNVGAVVAALEGLPCKVVLIAGGRDKGGDYAPLAAVLGRVGRGAVLIGEAAPRLAAALSPVTAVERAATMDEAVAAAARMAARGDAVVLSPACSSFDMYRDYEHRADAFRAAVVKVARAAVSS